MVGITNNEIRNTLARVFGHEGIVMIVDAVGRADFEMDALLTELTGGRMSLFKADLAITPITTLAALDAVKADFGGYADIVLPAPGQIYQELPYTRKMVIPTQQFNASGVAPANDVYGHYIVGQGGALLRIVKYDAPIHMETALDSIPITEMFEDEGKIVT